MGDATDFLEFFGVDTLDEFIEREMRAQRRNRPSSIPRFSLNGEPKRDPKGEWVRYDHHLLWAKRMRQSLAFQERETERLRHDLERVLANHSADLTGGSESEPT